MSQPDPKQPAKFDRPLPPVELVDLTGPDGETVSCAPLWQDTHAIGVAFDFSEESLGLISVCLRNIVDLDKQPSLRAG